MAELQTIEGTATKSERVGGKTETQAEASRSSSAMHGAVLQLATARGLAIAVSFATAPIMGRLYPPHAYGALGIFTTLLSVLAAFASASYVSAIPIAKTPGERRDLFVLCVLIGFGTTAIVTVGTLLGANLLAQIFHEPDLAKYGLFLPLLFLGNAIRQLLDTTLSCQRRYGAVALRNVLEISVGRLVQFGACLVGLMGSPAGLIVGSLAGNSVSAVAAGSTSVREVLRSAGTPVRLAGLRAAAVEHRKFPLILFWSQTINAITFGLPAMLLGARFSIETVGLYTMACTMVTLPLQLFTSSANQVFYVEVADRIGKGQSAVSITEDFVRMLAALTSFPLLVVLSVGPLVFGVFLGAKWTEAGIFAGILVPWMALVAIASPLSVAYQVLRRQGEGLAWNLVLLAARFSALYFGSLLFGVRGTLALFAAVSTLLFGWLIVRILKLLGVSRRRAAGTIARAYIEPALFLAPAAILYWYFTLNVTALIAVGAATVAYGFLLYYRHPQLIKPVLAALKKVRTRIAPPAIS